MEALLVIQSETTGGEEEGLFFSFSLLFFGTECHAQRECLFRQLSLLRFWFSKVYFRITKNILNLLRHINTRENGFFAPFPSSFTRMYFNIRTIVLWYFIKNMDENRKWGEGSGGSMKKVSKKGTRNL